MGAIADSARVDAGRGPETATAPVRHERRDLEARDARDRLAVLLNMQPGDLRRIGAGEARAMINAIETARAEGGATRP